MDYYDILLVSRSASAEEIQKAYRILAKKYHPDVYDGDKDFAEEQMKFINEAYSVLSDPQARKEYDRKLNETENKSNSESSSKEQNTDNTYNNDQNAEHEETSKKVIKPFLLIRWPLITAVLFLCSLMSSKYLFWIGIVLMLIRLSANLFNKEYRSKRFTQNDIAQDYLDEGEYDKAIDELNKYNEFFYDYYQLGEELFAEGRYEDAVTAFIKAENYNDSADKILMAEEKIKQKHYTLAETYFSQGDNRRAVYEYRMSGWYNNSLYEHIDLFRNYSPITLNNVGTLGIQSDGTLISSGYVEGYEEALLWKNIVDISCGDLIAGLRADGTVDVEGYDAYRKKDVAGWTGIKSISAESGRIIGLHENGTVIYTGRNQYDERTSMDQWTDIVSIDSGYSNTVGLKSDGTVVAAGRTQDGECEVEGWTNIIDVAASYGFTVGLQANGIPVIAGEYTEEQYRCTEWTDIIAIYSNGRHIVGLKADGTVMATGFNDYSQFDFDLWKLW